MNVTKGTDVINCVPIQRALTNAVVMKDIV